MLPAQHPQVSVLYSFGAVLIEGHEGDLVDAAPVDSAEKGVGVVEPSRVEGCVDGVIVGTIVQVISETVGHGLDPCFVDGSVVKLAPEGAIRKVYDVEAQISEKSVFLRASEVGKLKTEILVIVEALVEGGRLPFPFLKIL
jgi:hypothetical protein